MNFDPNRILLCAAALLHRQQALVDRVPHHTPILLVFQRDYEKALNLTRQRKAARNPKATAGWTSVQEEEWRRLLAQCRHGEAVWIGSACAPEIIA